MIARLSGCGRRRRLWRPTRLIVPRAARGSRTRSVCGRGDVYELRAPRGARGGEQRGNGYAVVVQSDLLPLSTWLVAPTSTGAREATFRPGVSIEGRRTRVLAEQTSAVDPQRLGESAGHLSFDELRQVDAALRLVLGL